MTRRTFMTAVAAACFAPLADRRQSEPQALKVDAQRLRRRLETLSQFGRTPEGGVSRVGFSQADREARQFVVDQMRQAGLSVRIDEAGNLFGRSEYRERNPPTILFGSHIDSVPDGGNFDGDVGSMGAIEVAQVLLDARYPSQHPLEVVIWANEEGVAYGNGLFGSRAAAGELVAGELDHVWNGVKKSDAIRGIGGDPDRIQSARLAPGSIRCYLELHIEQGGILDREKIPIGVVEGIVAIDRYETTIRGFANHAGTTPMPERKDALVAASRLIVAVREIVMAEPGRQVGTVGRLEVSPNAPNVIPGVVRHTIELRDLSSEKIKRLADLIKTRAREIADQTGMEITIEPTSHHDPALCDGKLQLAIEQASKALGLQTRRLPSGAGHDAQMMAKLAPIGMIFVPSVGGISHSPKELTRWEDCANGASVLLNTILLIDSGSVHL